jgi:hypothetical protein
MRPKIKIGTTFPFFWKDRFVNAEVVSCVKVGKRFVWTVRLTESQRPLVWESERGELSGQIVELRRSTREIANAIQWIESLPTFGPARIGSCVVQWIDFGQWGRWCEVKEFVVCGPSRPTHWDKCEYGTVEELIASGDAKQIGART